MLAVSHFAIGCAAWQPTGHRPTTPSTVWSFFFFPSGIGTHTSCLADYPAPGIAAAGTATLAVAPAQGERPTSFSM